MKVSEKKGEAYVTATFHLYYQQNESADASLPSSSLATSLLCLQKLTIEHKEDRGREGSVKK